MREREWKKEERKTKKHRARNGSRAFGPEEGVSDVLYYYLIYSKRNWTPKVTAPH